jgi:Zinc carboxypeptidase
MKIGLFFLLISCLFSSQSFCQKTVFETSNGKQSATYFETIAFFKKLKAAYKNIGITTWGETDAGYPLHTITYCSDGNTNSKNWKNKTVVLINNGIHPGEPDGIDASMMLLRDLANNTIKLPSHIAVAIIPVYNIGGALNRGAFSRVNQNGPEFYGFRGNAQNLDLNRDFIKCDTKEAKVFTTIFQSLQPAIFIDNHVSDGADYQHTMTLLTTQHSKLGGAMGKLLHTLFEPELFANMQLKGWPMCPYVNFEDANVEKGWNAFYESPRYSSGYAALFGTMAFVPETHMLKPFKDRVLSTYALMETILNTSAKHHLIIQQKRKEHLQEIQQQQSFPLSFVVDTTKFDIIKFLGFTPEYTTSQVTGLQKMQYNHNKPFEKQVKFYNYFNGVKWATKPKAYVIQQGWHSVLQLLQLNNVKMQRLKNDTSITVSAYKINNYKASSKPYEKHFRLTDISATKELQTIRFLKGDFIIYTNQIADRFLVETLEPFGDDSYLSWNFFDAVLQQKEGYSNYRWEDVAADYLKANPALQKQFEEKRKTDAKFAANANAQLDFVYKNSPYYEPIHMRHPVFRIE